MMTNTGSNIVETIFETQKGYNECEHCQSVLSPAAYFVKLMETVEKYIEKNNLKERRPDLFDIKLDCESTNKTKLYLEIINEILEKKLGTDVLKEIAKAKYPFNLPANINLIKIRAYLKDNGINLADVFKVLIPDSDNFIAESLGLSPEEYNIIIDHKNSDFHAFYGIDKDKVNKIDSFIDIFKKIKIEENFAKLQERRDELATNNLDFENVNSPPKNQGSETTTYNKEEALEWCSNVIKALKEMKIESINKFTNQTKLQRDEINNLLNCYNRLHNLEKESLGIEFDQDFDTEIIKNLSNNSLCFLHRFIRLSNKLGWSFNELADVLSAIDGKAIDKETLKKIEKIRDLQQKLKKPLIEVCKLYSYSYTLDNTDAEAKSVAESLCFASNLKKSQIEVLYGIEKPLEPFKEQSVSEFMLQSGIDYELIENLIKNKFNKIITKDYKLSKEELGFLDFFNKLSREIKLLLKTLDTNEKLKNLEIENDSDRIILEKLLAVDRNELESLINYNSSITTTKPKSTKSKLSSAYSQVMLASLMSITTSELIQILITLDIDDLTSDKIEQVLQFNDWLKDKSLAIDKVNQLINSSFHSNIKEVDSIQKALKKEGKGTITDKELDIVQGITNVDLDILEASYEFTKKRLTKLQLLRLEHLDKSIVQDVALIGKKVIFFEKSKVQVSSSTEYDIPSARDKMAVATVGENIIFFGGEASKNNATERIDIYNTKSKQWVTKSASEASYGSAVAVINDKAIFFSGKKSKKDFSSQIEIYSHDARKIEEKKIVDRPRVNVSVAVVDNKVIFFGGRDNKGASYVVDIYDEKDDEKKWKTHNISSQRARENASVAVVGNKAIFFGGKIEGKRSDKIDIYDSKTEKWEELDYRASEARDEAVVAVVNNQAIFFGGKKSSDEYSLQVDIYDAKTNQWQSISIEQPTSKGTSATVIDDKVIFFTPIDDSKAAGRLNIYDSNSKSWLQHIDKESEPVIDYNLEDIESSLSYSKKVSVYDPKAKKWKNIDIYKEIDCQSIDVRDNRLTIKYKDSEETYSIKFFINCDITINQLMDNVNIFKMFNLNVEEIKAIDENAELLGIKTTWTKKQVYSIGNYKALSEQFSGNKINLGQYIEWLNSSFDENKIVEKICDLTGWDKKAVKDTKEIFKELFTKAFPIDPLLKAKSFFDLAIESRIDANDLLKLKDLTWDNYKKLEEELSKKINIKEKTKNSLESQKRNILVSYFLDKNRSIKNMRELYAHLLIDVEMSDCQKISPLKAALNSAQLYIHRCMMGLEEVKVSTEFTEEKWDLLNNYREWEANKKLSLYPENFLDPTLRRTATAQFKEFQDTLMQGAITDDAASDAYLKYFESFSSLLNLEKVDTHFANDKVYVVGRTLEEPYIYYYRVAGYKEKDGKEGHTWGPWKKIEIQAPVKTLRLIHAFGKLFVFWLQKTDREKQIEDISIDDSVLNTYFIFQKPDGSWSAQQKMQYEVKRDQKYENEIREYLWVINEHKQHIAMRGEDDSANQYCKDEITENKNLIKNKIDELKKLEFFGKLAVTMESEVIKITSMELGFNNITFKLNKNFKLEQSFDNLKDSDLQKYIDNAKASIETTIENIIEEQKKAYKNEYEKLEGDITSINREIGGLEGKKKPKETEKSNKEEKFQGQNLSKKIQKLEKEFNGDNSTLQATEGKTDVESLNARIKNLLDKVIAGKNSETERKKELGSKLQQLKGEVDKLKGDEITTDSESEENELFNQLNHLETQIKESTKNKNPIEENDTVKNKYKNALGKVREYLIKKLENLEKSLDLKTKNDKKKILVSLKALTEKQDNARQEQQNKLDKAQAETEKQQQEVLQGESSTASVDDQLQSSSQSQEAQEKALTEHLQALLGFLKTLNSGNELDSENWIQKMFDDSGMGNIGTEKALKAYLEALDKLQKQHPEINDNSSKKEILQVKSEYLLEYVKIDSEKLETLKNLENKIETLKKEEIYKTLLAIVALNSEISELNGKINIKKGELQLKQEEKNSRYSKGPKEKDKELDKEKDRKIKELNALNSLKDPELDSIIQEIYNASYTKNIRIALQEKLSGFVVGNFEGFNGIYLYEIFFHIPTVIAYLFNQEQEFAKARRWHQCIFDPTKKGCEAWKFHPFKNKCGKKSYSKECDPKNESGNLVDPYVKAHNKPTSFEKYIIKSYVDNIIDWGDMRFREESWEGINEATMLYVRAWDLLGERPKKKIKSFVKPAIACQLLDNKNATCIKAETDAPAGTDGESSSETQAEKVLDTISYCSYFCTPENKEFTDLWNTIEDRLYKIRHCLDIRGKKLELPLFQPPIDPRQLLSAAAGGSGSLRLPKFPIPHYRFSYMINYAKSLADNVSQIGSEFLSVLEKRDAEEMNLLYNKQEGIIANLITTIKEKAIESLKKEEESLNEGLNSAKYRKKHYEKLIVVGLSNLEKSAEDKSMEAIILLWSGVAAGSIAVAAHLIPTIFGFSVGGLQPGSSIDSAASTLQTTSNALSNISQNISTSASYERREEDWTLQQQMATHDVEQIKYQIEANKINQLNAEQDLKAHKESIKQIKEKGDFFRNKFTSKELYSWMKGELARLYFQAYKLAVEVARQAEWSYQYELDNNKSFIKNGHWNSLKQGLLAGSKLKFELEQLNKEYHDNNERRLEITKVISLKQIEPIALYDLKTKGECKFALTEKLFDLDFPGHYCRKIKGIRITIPAVVGPYENVHATLQQTGNKLSLQPDIEAIKYLLGETTEQLETVRESYKNNQQIAISRGDQDSGLFEFNFNDERYLPFEGTGVVSNWILKLPKSTNRFDINSISDVIIHIDYTAIDGGEKLVSEVKKLPKLEKYSGFLMINLKSAYAKEWEEFKKNNELNIVVSSNMFPSYITNPEIEEKLYLLPSDTGIKIKINDKEWNKNDLTITNLNIGETWQIKASKKIENMIMFIPYSAKMNW